MEANLRRRDSSYFVVSFRRAFANATSAWNAFSSSLTSPAVRSSSFFSSVSARAASKRRPKLSVTSGFTASKERSGSFLIRSAMRDENTSAEHVWCASSFT